MKMELGEYGMKPYLLRLVACLFLCVSLNSFGASTSMTLQLMSVEDTSFYMLYTDEECSGSYILSTNGNGCISSSYTDSSSQNQFGNFDFHYGHNGSYIENNDDLEWQPSSGQLSQTHSLQLNFEALFSTGLDLSNSFPYDFMFLDDFSFSGLDWEGQHELIINIDNDFILDFSAFEEVVDNGWSVDRTTISYDGSSIIVSLMHLEFDDWQEQIYRFHPSPIPLPAAAWLFGSALAGLLVARRKK